MTETITRITLVRHGHVHNPRDVVYGRLPGFALSDVGRQQAEAAAEQLRGADLAALFASPQLRAQQTATLIRRYHPTVTTIISPLLDEIRCYFEGHSVSEVEARGWDLYTGVGEGYETPPDIAARAVAFVEDSRRRHVGEHVAAVSHGDVIAFLILRAMRQPAEVGLKRTLGVYGITDAYPATASLTTLTYRTQSPAEVPELSYVRPYGEHLALAALS